MVGKRIALACLLVGLACDAQPRGRGSDQGPGADGKADDANTDFDPALSDHQNDVRACLGAASKDRSADRYRAELTLLECVADANDAVLGDIQDVLPDEIPDDFTDELIDTKGDEAERYLDRLRASQEQVCEVFGVLIGGDDEDDAALVEMRCLAASEVHTANLIDAHFDLGGRRLELASTDDHVQRCQDNFDEHFEEGYEEVEGPPRPDQPSSESEWLVHLHHDRRDCMKGEDAEMRVDWARDLGDFRAHADEDFRGRLRIVTRGLERESRAGRLLCRLFSYQERDDERALAEALCMADSTMQAGQLFDELRDNPDVDETGGDRPEPEPEPMPQPQPPSEEGEACYPGPDGTWDVCIPIFYPSGELQDYDYAAALNGNQNYRRPIGFIDLDAVDGSTQISKNFTLAEVAHRWKGRYAVVQPHAVASLQRLRDDVGSITVNSGFRSPKYNRGVGGATYSRHMYGDGFDMDPNSVPLSTLEEACGANGGFLVEYTSHVHCDFRFDDADESFFGAL